MDINEIERQRQLLETQVNKLKASLKHWQTWDAEYEGLKEELQGGTFDTEQQLSDLSTSYDGALVNTKEMQDLFGLSANSPRKTDQIINLIDRRIDYVTKNIETISHQFYAAEGKLEEFEFAYSTASGQDPRFDDESVKPFIEIHEELDDNDNIISSEVRKPVEEARNILQRIETQSKDSAPAKQSDSAEAVDDEHDSDGPHRPSIRKKSVSFSADTKPAPQPEQSPSQDGRKSVSFAPKIAIAPAADPPDARSVSFSPTVEEIPAPVPESPEINRELQKDLRASFKPGDKVYELNEDDEPANRHVVLPENESPEDARLRREMLNYHLNEVGSVVAQLDLEEDDHSDFAGSEYPDDIDTPITTSDEEDEDEYGRTKHNISADYHAQMAELQAQLNTLDADAGSAPLIGNLGPSDQLPDAKDVRRLVIRDKRSSLSSATSSASDSEKKAGKKRVSFAEALDVATESPPQKMIKRDDEAEIPGPIIADTLVERKTTSSATAPSNDEEVMMRRELANEYYKQRNNMIKQQGGFSNDDDEELGELMEERDGKLKKVSKFKAARLK